MEVARFLLACYSLPGNNPSEAKMHFFFTLIVCGNSLSNPCLTNVTIEHVTFRLATETRMQPRILNIWVHSNNVYFVFAH